jgi:hypothetical protein
VQLLGVEMHVVHGNSQGSHVLSIVFKYVDTGHEITHALLYKWWVAGLQDVQFVPEIEHVTHGLMHAWQTLLFTPT